MKNRTILLALIPIMLFGLPLTVIAVRSQVINLAANESAEINCDGQSLNLTIESRTQIIAKCNSDDVPPVPTDTNSQLPTEANPTDDLANIPLCDDHNPEIWHALTDAGRNCHYDHEHKDDPQLVDDIFGPVGALYGGQELSYPWQTFSDAGTENELKHQGYGWLVRRDMGCFSQYSGGCITDFRLQFHAIMAAHGAVTRFHSYWLEARGCREDNPEVCGIIRTGGWVDFGHLEIDGQHIPLPGDPAEFKMNTGPRRIHHYEGNTNFGTWYGRNGNADIALQTSRMWGLVLPDDPYQLNLFCPDNQCQNNGSNMQAHVIAPRISGSLDTDGDGIVNFEGYTNRYGDIVDDCTEVGLDCVPLQIINMPAGYYQYRDDAHEIVHGYFYDTSPSDEWWITYPN